MGVNNDESAFNEALIARTKRWREEKGWTAQQMADVLGVPAERYRKYEYRTPLPAYLMQRFCLVCDADLEQLLLGKPRTRPKPTLVPNEPDSRRA